MGPVERFSEISGSSFAGRTTWLSGFVALPAHLVIALVSSLLLGRVTWIDATRMQVVAWGFVGLSAVCAGIARSVDARHAEGRWTSYLFTLPYGALSAYSVYQFGVLGSPLMAWYPVIIMVVCLWYDARAGLVALGFGLLLYVPLFVLSATGAIDYAPAVLDRSIDRQTEGTYVVALAILILLYVLIGSLAAAVNVEARALAKRSLDLAHHRLNKATRLIAHYVPSELATDILEGTDDTARGHHRRKVTVFFSDIVGFVDLAEELEPEDLAMVLNEYFTEMTEIAARHHGFVDELQGDALLILFGVLDPVSDREHALRAAGMAAEMQAALVGLNQRWRSQGITEEVRVRAAAHTGVVTVGTFGSASRKKYAAVGKPVNVAARLQAIAEPGTLLVSHATCLLVEDGYECTARGPVELKGVSKPIEVFEVGAAITRS